MQNSKILKPILIFGYGNPSRGDDAIGPEFLRLLETERAAGRAPDNFDTLTDFQLQIEHATDLEGRELVLFVDAAVSGPAPFSFTRLQAQRDEGITSHAISPANVLSVYEQVFSADGAPAAFLLSIPGQDFELGQRLSEQSIKGVAESILFAKKLLEEPNQAVWDEVVFDRG